MYRKFNVTENFFYSAFFFRYLDTAEWDPFRAPLSSPGQDATRWDGRLSAI
jgi:hypothetical protein